MGCIKELTFLILRLARIASFMVCTAAYSLMNWYFAADEKTLGVFCIDYNIVYTNVHLQKSCRNV
jgi:hypothetical protein